MIPSRSSLSRTQIVASLVGIVGASAVVTEVAELQLASVDRFKKYQSVHGLFEGPIPAAIVRASSTEDVSKVLAFADEHLLNVVPRTGGTGTEGGLETIVEDSIVLDCSPMNQIISIDETNMMATAQCGVPLQVLEDALRAVGLTTGHSPQSKPIAQMGGLVATRSIGQLSTLYGGIEDMVVGLEAVFPGGAVSRIKNVPRRAAGPDVRHIVIGSEGSLCVVTEVTVKLYRHYPEHVRFFGFLMDDFGKSVEALRQLVTSGYRPSVCRVYSPQDARQHWDWSGDKNVVVLIAEGPKPIVDATADAIESLFATIPHEQVDSIRIANWFNHLNWGQDKIDAEKADMLANARLGYTTEVSVDWSRAGELYSRVMSRVGREFPRFADLTMLGAHSSHSYQTGTNLYFVYDYAIRCEPLDELRTYHVPLNAIIVEEALAVGGSMVHHHGVGKYRTPWVRQEHGSAWPMLEALKAAFDPNGIMNAGTIFPVEGFRDPLIGLPTS